MARPKGEAVCQFVSNWARPRRGRVFKRFVYDERSCGGVHSMRRVARRRGTCGKLTKGIRCGKEVGVVWGCGLENARWGRGWASNGVRLAGVGGGGPGGGGGGAGAYRAAHKAIKSYKRKGCKGRGVAGMGRWQGEGLWEWCGRHEGSVHGRGVAMMGWLSGVEWQGGCKRICVPPTNTGLAGLGIREHGAPQARAA